MSGHSAYIKVKGLCQLSCVCQNFSSLVGRKSSERSGVEPRILKSKTPVHTVCCKLEGLLLDVVLNLCVCVSENIDLHRIIG